MMRSRMVTGIAVAAAVTAGGVGGAIIGVPGLSGAQPFPANVTATGAPTPGDHVRPASKLLDAAATALKLTTQQLMDKLKDGKTTIADVAKTQGVDVKAVIQAITDADKGRIDDIVNKPWPQFGPGGGPEGRFGGPGKRGFGMGIVGQSLDAVAGALGITTDELKTDLGKGQTIAQIATAKGRKVDDVITKLVDDATAKIKQAVTDGKLTQDMADNITGALKTEIRNLVNNGFPKGPMGGFGFGGRQGHGGPPGMDFGGPDSGSTSTTTPPSA